MKIIRLYIVMSLVLFSCANSPREMTKSAAKEIKIELIAQYHKPYCGGAYPSPEQERGSIHPISNETFYIKRGKLNTENEMSLLSFTTDENGKATIWLPAGEYVVIKATQNFPFDKFYQPYQQKENSTTMTYLGEDCYREWYAKPETSFTVAEEQRIIQFTRQTNCFTSENPCARYTGPLPP